MRAWVPCSGSLGKQGGLTSPSALGPGRLDGGAVSGVSRKCGANCGEGSGSLPVRLSHEEEKASR